MAFSLRELNEINSNELFQLYERTVNESFEEWLPESKQQWISQDFSQEFWNELLNNPATPVVGAFDIETLIGYAAIETVTFGVAYFSWLGVLKSHQNKGVGSSLMKHIEELCKIKGYHKLELETQNPSRRSFYEKNGYSLEGNRKNSWQHLDNYMFGKSIR